MSPSHIRVDGAVILTSLTEFTRLAKLREGLLQGGLGDFCPQPRSPGAAMKDAVTKAFPRQLVKPLKAADSWEILDIEYGDDANTYKQKYVVRFRIDENDNPKISIGPWDQETADRLVATFNDQMGLVRCAQVTGCLTSILAKLGGTSLRPRGAVYWLSGHQLDTWQKATDAVEAAGVGGENKCFLIRHSMDADALRAVRDAIINEVKSEVAKIEADVQGGELGERALAFRKDQAKELVEKIRLYEDLLSTPLPDLLAEVDKCEMSVMTASMSLSLGAV